MSGVTCLACAQVEENLSGLIARRQAAPRAAPGIKRRTFVGSCVTDICAVRGGPKECPWKRTIQRGLRRCRQYKLHPTDRCGCETAVDGTAS